MLPARDFFLAPTFNILISAVVQARRFERVFIDFTPNKETDPCKKNFGKSPYRQEMPVDNY